MSDPLRDYTEAADWLGVPRKWLETEVQAGRAPHVRLGKYVRFTQSHLDQLISTHEKRGAPAPTPTVEAEAPRRGPTPATGSRRRQRSRG